MGIKAITRSLAIYFSMYLRDQIARQTMAVRKIWGPPYWTLESSRSWERIINSSLGRHADWSEVEEDLVSLQEKTHLDRAVVLEIARMTVTDDTSVRSIIQPCIKNMELRDSLSCADTLVIDRRSILWATNGPGTALLDIIFDVLARTLSPEINHDTTGLQQHLVDVLGSLTQSYQ